ncbi:MAG: ArsR/SmtB family transcription factor [Thermoprotei archaeon]|jgi:DNA-binding PadR family transcriptional regulator
MTELRFDYSSLEGLVEVLSAKARVSIMMALRDGPKSSTSLYEQLNHNGFPNMERSTFYYHLQKLRTHGLIKESGSISGAGKPEKIWTLSADTLVISLR